MSQVMVNFRMDEELKKSMEETCKDLGLSMTTAFTIFVRPSLREGGIPFKISKGKPNQETITAILESERIARDPSIQGYTSVDELFADLDA